MATNEYQKQADDFLKETNTIFKADFLKYDYHFDGDKEERDVYKITLIRGGREYSFNFGQSLNNSGLKVINKNNGKQYGKTISTELYKKWNSGTRVRMEVLRINGFPMISCYYLKKPVAPNSYDVLACLTTYDPETFEDFCGEFGYDTDSIRANKTYKAVVEEFSMVCKLWNDTEIEKLQEIN